MKLKADRMVSPAESKDIPDSRFERMHRGDKGCDGDEDAAKGEGKDAK